MATPLTRMGSWGPPGDPSRTTPSRHGCARPNEPWGQPALGHGSPGIFPFVADIRVARKGVGVELLRIVAKPAQGCAAPREGSAVAPWTLGREVPRSPVAYAIRGTRRYRRIPLSRGPRYR